jgi:hypothetical protein
MKASRLAAAAAALDSHVTPPSRPGWHGQVPAKGRDVLIAAATTAATILLTCALIAIIVLLAIFMTDQSPMKKSEPTVTPTSTALLPL